MVLGWSGDVGGWLVCCVYTIRSCRDFNWICLYCCCNVYKKSRKKNIFCFAMFLD